MSTAGDPRLADAAARLEEISVLLDGGDLAPAQLRDLADEALEIAQRISVLIAQDTAVAGRPPTPDPPAPPAPNGA